MLCLQLLMLRECGGEDKEGERAEKGTRNTPAQPRHGPSTSGQSLDYRCLLVGSSSTARVPSKKQKKVEENRSSLTERGALRGRIEEV